MLFVANALSWKLSILILVKINWMIVLIFYFFESIGDHGWPQIYTLRIYLIVLMLAQILIFSLWKRIINDSVYLALVIILFFILLSRVFFVNCHNNLIIRFYDFLDHNFFIWDWEIIWLFVENVVFPLLIWDINETYRKVIDLVKSCKAPIWFLNCVYLSAIKAVLELL